MNVTSCDFYRMKPEVLPPQAKPIGLYVRQGRLPVYVDLTEWELIGRDASPEPAIVAEVARRGYCARELAACLEGPAALDVTSGTSAFSLCEL